MKNKIKNWFGNAKIQKKIMIIYICIGTIPILLLGLFALSQERKTLMERERRNIEDSLSQGASQLKSQILVYNNLSDYIAFNQPISDVLIGDYDDIFSMYEQYTATVDPVLSSLKYFNPNINQITIYLDEDIVKHDTTVDSLHNIEGEKWYREYKNSVNQKVKWIIDGKEKTSFSARTMPIMEQNKQKGILYLDVNYDTLFSGFDDISRDGYGLYVIDKAGNVLFEKDTFDQNNENKAAIKKDRRDQSAKNGTADKCHCPAGTKIKENVCFSNAYTAPFCKVSAIEYNIFFGKTEEQKKEIKETPNERERETKKRLAAGCADGGSH